MSRPRRKYAAAVALGRRGAQGRQRNLSPEQRSELARRAAVARWARATVEDRTRQGEHMTAGRAAIRRA